MEIRPYTSYCEEEILHLYTSVGWTNYTSRPDLLRAAFSGSLLVLGAFDGSRLVGILRAVGDGASILYIQDLLLLPAYQRKGIGKALISRAQEHYPDVYQTVLMTDTTEKTAAFYRACGFTRDADLGCCGFMRCI